jgi:CRP/FNR family transcriptional regulator, cyclic AMP receptor protein
MQIDMGGRMSANSERSLKGVTLFAELPADIRRSYEQRCRWCIYDRGQQIIDSETKSSEVFFVISGTVRVVDYSSAGRQVTFATLGHGDVVGELAAIDGGPRCASVVATVETLLAIMSSDILRHAIREHSTVAVVMLKRLAGIVRVSNNRIMELSSLGAHNRVYAEILRMARSAGGGDGMLRINPTPLHADIASRVSTTRETVARALSDLSRQGIVSRDHDALVVMDPQRLADMVENFRSE